jgi:hypothetical protein
MKICPVGSSDVLHGHGLMDRHDKADNHYSLMPKNSLHLGLRQTPFERVLRLILLSKITLEMCRIPATTLELQPVLSYVSYPKALYKQHYRAINCIALGINLFLTLCYHSWMDVQSTAGYETSHL